MKRWEILHSTDPQKETQTYESIRDIILSNRGITEKQSIDNFLNPQLNTVTCTSVGIKKSEVSKALKRIKKSIESNKTIVIYGDYDVDGICATGIMWEALYSSYEKTRPYIPHRVDEGYGISKAGIDTILKTYDDVDVIITVDNGIVAYEAIQYAVELGIDVIITDHHVREETLPPAYAVIHSTKLCGAGIAYLMAKEFLGTSYREGGFLDLVTLATVADLVPLTDANRALVYHGLNHIRKTNRIGLRELFDEAKINPFTIGVYEIGHVIAPRMNATGRLSSAVDSLRLICTKDSGRAKILASKLASANKERQMLTKDLSEHALQLSKAYEEEHIIIVGHETYNQGVIGLIASRIVEHHYKPTLVLSIGEEYAKGSARSIRGVNIIEMIRSVSDLVIQAGGHPMAAGFTIATTNIEAFRNALQEKALSVINKDHLIRVLNIDLELEWSVITHKLYMILQELAPFGMGNPEPVFSTRNVEVCDVRTMGKDHSHYRLILEQEGKRVEAVAFGMAAQYKIAVNDTIDIAYTVDFDTWNGKNKVVLKIKDIRQPS